MTMFKKRCDGPILPRLPDMRKGPDIAPLPVSRPEAGPLIATPAEQVASKEPYTCTIIRSAENGLYCLVWVRYTYEAHLDGQKILLFKNITTHRLEPHLNNLDPHFQEEGIFAPVARFTPTMEGWRMGMQIAGNIPDWMHWK